MLAFLKYQIPALCGGDVSEGRMSSVVRHVYMWTCLMNSGG